MRYIFSYIALMCSLAVFAAEPVVQFDFVDAPLSAAVESLAQQAGKKVKVSDKIKRTITLSSNPIPWSEALAVIKSRFNLTEHFDGEFLWLEPKAENKKEKRVAKQFVSDKKHSVREEQYSLRLYKLKNYPAQKVLAIVTDSKNRIFSNLVYAQIVEDQNIIMVRADNNSHRQIQLLINVLDKQRPRIRILSKIVIAKDQATNELGVRLGARSISGNWGIAGGSNGVFAPAGDRFLGINDNLVLDLGINQIPAGRATLGFSDGSNLIELELQALEANGKIDIIASPEVTVLSGSQATIATGTEVPYTQVVDNKADILFKEALIKLEVTPNVIGVDQIRMDIVIHLDNVGQQYNGIPSIDTNRLDTQVILKHGQTLILGGIFKTINTDSDKRVPLLSDIPVLGWLFRQKTVTKEKAELLVFITPNLVVDE